MPCRNPLIFLVVKSPQHFRLTKCDALEVRNSDSSSYPLRVEHEHDYNASAYRESCSVPLQDVW